eukprot:4488016-Pleurochrysis_carterae.AAC.2
MPWCICLLVRVQALLSQCARPPTALDWGSVQQESVLRVASPRRRAAPARRQILRLPRVGKGSAQQTDATAALSIAAGGEVLARSTESATYGACVWYVTLRLCFECFESASAVRRSSVHSGGQYCLSRGLSRLHWPSRPRSSRPAGDTRFLAQDKLQELERLSAC